MGSVSDIETNKSVYLYIPYICISLYSAYICNRVVPRKELIQSGRGIEIADAPQDFLRVYIAY